MPSFVPVEQAAFEVGQRMQNDHQLVQEAEEAFRTVCEQDAEIQLAARDAERVQLQKRREAIQLFGSGERQDLPTWSAGRA
ncbi:unnamed protein product [Vitrella brassicaformis CCMP3155]|uniref:Uncharacterized protein n=1 Tax=Vitrella brassicaformis (strain CCMP3155) TaxID=1169540 RepID=A0A0G4GEC6_VITBC|nr:unnamed protein product [Vitrella brassicaformis CCMP3155]|mmetsp:Transcript_46704/g.116385  ORF Transcript_46704/g.116385 Transcript_46704/m.116385 type:complete len:81 (+) Transcript_46704:866-1108(+)|eukprot:CEM27476.1 unnamed protein product [Vitrella brassicaformis CCMP3155]